MTIEAGDLGIADGPAFVGRKAQMFPILTSAQIARLTAHGSHRHMTKGEILAEPGDRNRPMLVVLSGSIEVVAARHERRGSGRTAHCRQLHG